MAYVAGIVDMIFYVYLFLIFLWCVLSWIPRGEGGFVSELSDALGRLVVPFLSLFRFVPPIGALDVSPLLAILVLEIVQRFVVEGLMALA